MSKNDLDWGDVEADAARMMEEQQKDEMIASFELLWNAALKAIEGMPDAVKHDHPAFELVETMHGLAEQFGLTDGYNLVDIGEEPDPG